MEFDPTTLARRDAYQLLTACLVPRPIAWTSTVDAQGRPNLAPFSFFGGVTTDPMTVMVSVGRRRGERKDTARNLLEVGEAVIHIVTRPLATQMVKTSGDLAAGESEFEYAGLEVAPAVRVRPPRIAAAAIAMEATLQQHLEVGKGPVDVFLLEVVQLFVRNDVLDQGLPDAAKLAAVGRLGAAGYCETTPPFEVQPG